MGAFIHLDSGLTIDVWPDVESDWFIGAVRELPGCASQGTTEREALESSVDALLLVLEVIQEDDPARYEHLVGRDRNWDMAIGTPGKP